MATKNQRTEALKAAIFRTFNELQEDGEPHSLINWARENPKDFYCSLLTRLLPKPVEVSAAAGVNFAIVYQIGDTQMTVGPDGQLRALPDPDVVDAECSPAIEAGGQE